MINCSDRLSYLLGRSPCTKIPTWNPEAVSKPDAIPHEYLNPHTPTPSPLEYLERACTLEEPDSSFILNWNEWDCVKTIIYWLWTKRIPAWFIVKRKSLVQSYSFWFRTKLKAISLSELENKFYTEKITFGQTSQCCHHKLKPYKIYSDKDSSHYLLQNTCSNPLMYWVYRNDYYRIFTLRRKVLQCGEEGNGGSGCY